MSTLLALHLDANGQPLERTCYIQWRRAPNYWIAHGFHEIDGYGFPRAIGSVIARGHTKSDAVMDIKMMLTIR